MQQQEPTHFIHLRADSYTEIRDKLRQLAEEHGFYVSDALAAASEVVRRTAEPRTSDQVTSSEKSTGEVSAGEGKTEVAKKLTYLINTDADKTMKVRKGDDLPSEDDGWIPVSKKQFESYNDGLAQRKEAKDKEAKDKEAKDKEVAEEKLYCVHGESESAFIVEEGEALPGPDVDIVDRKTFRKFCVEHDLDPATGKPENEEDETGAAGEDADEEITLDDLKTAFGELVEAKGAPAAKKLVEGFGAEKVSQIEKDDYPQVMKKIQSLLKG